MKKINNILALLVIALMGLSLTACSSDDLDTNQYRGDVSLNAFGPNPVMRGGTLRFVGSNLDQVASITLPGMNAVTNYEVIKSGVPSEIRVAVPKDGPVVGKVVLKTKTDQNIETLNDLTYIEGIEVKGFTPAEADPGTVIRIEGDYLNLIYSLAFADGILVSSSDFKAWDRYYIEVEVPEEAMTGKIELYTADLTVQRTKEEEDNLQYQTIITEEALIVGTPSTSKLESPRGVAGDDNTVTAKAGEEITLTGDYYNVVAGIKFGDFKTEEFDINEDGTQLRFKVPAEAPSGAIVLVCKSSIEVPAGFFKAILPSECVAAPSPVKAGQMLTITGKDMDLVTGVKFYAKEGDITLAEDAITVSADKVVINAVPLETVGGSAILVVASGETVAVPFDLVWPYITGYNLPTISAGGTVTVKGSNVDLVKTIQFGQNSDVITVENATADEFTVKVPMNAQSGSPIVTLVNGNILENVPAITIEEAVFCYAVELPGEEVELKAGNSMTLTVANGDKLTGVEMNGTACQWILTGDDKNQLIIGIPETASASSKLRLISSNGEITYDITVIPATSVSKTAWSGLKEITWSDGGRVMIPAAAFEGVPEGATLTFCYTQKNGVWAQAQVNYGDWSGINFNQTGEGMVTFNGTLVPTDIYGWFSDGILNRETSVVLTQEIINNILAKKGGCEDQTNCGIIIQGSDLIFTKVTISYEISLEQNLANCVVRQDDQSALMPFPIKMTWDDSGRFRILIDKDPAIKDMKLVAGKSTMYFYASGTGQLQINNPNWGSMTTVAEWNDAGDKKMELILTDEIINCLKGVTTDGWSSTGLIIQGDGMTLSKITILP